MSGQVGMAGAVAGRALDSLPKDAPAGAEWNVAVITSREPVEELLATIEAVLTSVERPATVDVLVNGNRGLALAVAERIALLRTSAPAQLQSLRIWSFVLADKANTWNQYLHRIWSGEGTAYFVDGHCQPSRGGLEYLHEALLAAPGALAASAVPSMGRSARQWRDTILNDGGMVGGFLAIRQPVMAELRRRGFRLPLGLYGFDATLGAIFAFGLDPVRNAWDLKGRITAHPDATWAAKDKQWWRWSDLRMQFKRLVNVALRVLVGQALRDAFEVRRLRPEQLPRTTAEFVLGWVERDPRGARRAYRRSPLSLLALRQLREPRDWSAADLPPELIYASQHESGD